MGCSITLDIGHNGTQIVKAIGRHGAPWTPDTARTKARQLLGVVAGGTDPFAQSLCGEGFATTIDRYLERKKASVRPRSFEDIERNLWSLLRHSIPCASTRSTGVKSRRCWARSKMRPGQWRVTARGVPSRAYLVGASLRDYSKPIPFKGQPRPLRTKVASEY